MGNPGWHALGTCFEIPVPLAVASASATAEYALAKPVAPRIGIVSHFKARSKAPGEGRGRPGGWSARPALRAGRGTPHRLRFRCLFPLSLAAGWG